VATHQCAISLYRVEFKPVKRFVVKNEDGSLAIIGTSGFEPPNALCEAKEGWDARLLSWDHSTGICIIDPGKARAAHKESQKRESIFVIVREQSFLKSHWRKGAVAVFILAAAIAGFIILG
jgi:hypothetical protein